jgi:predicted KAP-like P-loop ATPase
MPDAADGMTRSSRLWSDDPLKSHDQDALNRGKFVSMVASRINACELRQSSTVFGLVGPWGSGKSSLINFIRAQLHDDWKVAIFSPWASSDPNGLQAEFLAALASVLEDGQGPKYEEAKKRLKKYSQVCTPLLKLIPYAGTAAADFIQKGIDLATASKPWHLEFENVSSTFEELGLKVLIVADDL